MSYRGIDFALTDRILQGKYRLALFSIGDCSGEVHCDGICEWANVDRSEAEDIICVLMSAGYLSTGPDGVLVHSDMVEHLRREDIALCAPDRPPRPKIGAVQRRRIFERDNYRCHYCGSRRRLSLDHVVPVSGGGTDDDTNLVTCCLPCNSAKGTRSYDWFIAYLRGRK